MNVQTVSNGQMSITSSLTKEETLDLIKIIENEDSVARFNNTHVYKNTGEKIYVDQSEALKDFRSYLKQDGKRLNKVRKKEKEREFYERKKMIGL